MHRIPVFVKDPDIIVSTTIASAVLPIHKDTWCRNKAYIGIVSIFIGLDDAIGAET